MTVDEFKLLLNRVNSDYGDGIVSFERAEAHNCFVYTFDYQVLCRVTFDEDGGVDEEIDQTMTYYSTVGEWYNDLISQAKELDGNTVSHGYW